MSGVPSHTWRFFRAGGFDQAMLVAALELRHRNLAPLLEANGWAVHARARVHIPFGRTLPSMPEFPPGSERSLDDPYADKRSRWIGVMVVLSLVGAAAWFLWERGALQRWFGLEG